MKKCRTRVVFRLLAVGIFACVQWSFSNTILTNGITWTYTVSNGEVSIGGGSYSSTAVPKSTSGPIEIPTTLDGYQVTSIGDYAFYACRGLTSVTIPDSVTSIGDLAFVNCGSMMNVTIPVSVTSIGDYAFEGCSGLTNMTIPDGVTSIGSSTFRRCSDLMRVTIPNNVTNIGSFAFYGCCNLTSVMIPDSVTGIGSGAFSSCSNLTSVTMPNGLTSIEDSMFANCSSLTNVIIPNSVMSIRQFVFYGCSGLTSVMIPTNVTSIGSSAFRGCNGLADEAGFVVVRNVLYDYCGNANDVTIPLGVTHIGSSAFRDCRGLTNIMISDSVTSIGDSAFLGCSGLTNVMMSDSVTGIEGFSFLGCSNLISVTIPRRVTHIGDSTFRDCCRLKSVTIPAGITSIGNYAFSGCSGLTNVVFEGNVPTVGTACFDGINPSCVAHVVSGSTGWGVEIPGTWNGMRIEYIINDETSGATFIISNGMLTGVELNGATEVTLPNGITSIGDGAFNGCRDLTSVTIPDSVTNIESYAFSNCISLLAFNVDERNTKYSSANNLLLSKDGKTLIQGVNGDVLIPDSVTSIGASTFYNCSCLTNVTIPESVTSIGESAFEGCSGLTGVTIPNSVTNIGYSAFKGCSGLASVVLPFVGARRGNTGSSDSLFGYIFGTSAYSGGKVTVQYYSSSSSVANYIPSSLKVVVVTDETALGYGAFYGCSGLTSVAISGNVTNIGYYVFCYCRNLKSVTISEGVTSVGFGEFYGCSGLMNVTISDTVTSISGYAFWGCSGLTSVTIPNSVTSIGGYAFGGCSGLTSVTIPNSVTSIGGAAFSGCNGLISMTIPFVGARRGNADSSDSLFGYIFGTSAYSGGEETAQWYSSSAAPIYYIPSSLNTVILTDETIIGYGAFYNCRGLTNVTIPDSVTNIASSAFANCSGLMSFIVGDSNPVFRAASGLLLTKDGKTLVQGVNGAVVIPDSVTNILEGAFGGRGGLTSVMIPDSVMSIGGSTFSGCYGLISMTMPFVGARRGNDAYPRDSLFGYIFGTSAYSGGNATEQFYSNSSSATYYIPSSLRTVVLTDETEIGRGAFYGCSDLTSVTIPVSVIRIGMRAFSGCSGLTSVTIPTSVTRIDSSTFSGCSGLTSVTIPDSVTLIDSFAFSGCSGLKSVTIPDSVTSIGSSAFSGCSGLESMVLPFVGARRGDTGSYASLFGCIFGTSAYSGGSATEQFYSSSSSATYYIPSSLKTVVLTDETTIGYGAFYGCSDLTSVAIPASVTSIGASAFFGCSGLTNVTIPSSVTSIGYSAFSGCSGLESMVLPFVGARRGDTDSSDSLFGYIFGTSAYSGGNATIQLSAPYHLPSTYYIPSSLKTVVLTDETEIGFGAFYNCSDLTSISIPDNVTKIGEHAFFGCVGLAAVHIANIGAWCKIKFTDAFSNPLIYAHNLYMNAAKIAELTIPDGVTDIGEYAFSDCSSLENVMIPASVRRIGGHAFGNCPNLQCEIRDGYKVICGWLVGYTENATSSISDVDGLRGIADGALAGCTALEELVFSEKAEMISIGNAALKGCIELQSLVLPPSLEAIGDEAFMGCSYLDNVVVPGSVKRVGVRAFKNCTGFTAAQIEYGVESLGDEAFYGDWQIVEVDIPSTVTNIGASAFGGDSSIIRVSLRGDIRSISGIFSNYQYIREATVKEGTRSIVANLFSGCSQLNDVHFFGNSPSLGGINIYMNTPSNLMTYVEQNSTGWDGTPGSHALPQAWPLSGNYRRSIAWWNVPTYLVQFDSNGGTLGVQDTYQQSERPFVLPPEPVQTGYTFAGWWTKPSGGLRVTADTVFIEGVYTRLYAHWTKGHWVFLDPNGGTVTNDFVTYVDQTVYGVLPVAVRKGYAFNGWRYVGQWILPTTHIANSADHTLTAQWDAYQYSIRFDANGGTGEMPDQPMEYDMAASLPLNRFSKLGSAFRGWATNQTGAVVYSAGQAVSNLTAQADGVVTLYAVWDEIWWPITYEDLRGATNPNPATYHEGSPVSFENPGAVTGYTFAGWMPNQITADMTGAQTVRAAWRANGYSIVYNANGGAGTMDVTGAEYDSEATVALNGFARTGYRFVGWATNETGEVVYASGQPVTNLTVEADGVVTLYAVWDEVWWLINYENLRGATNPNPAMYQEGAPVLFVNPGTVTGYTFAGWTPNQITADMTGAQTVSAAWRANGYSIVYNANGGTGTMDATGAEYDSEATVALNGFVRTGYRFVGWATNETGEVVYAAGQPVTNLTAQADGVVTLYGVWEIDVRGVLEEVFAGCSATVETDGRGGWKVTLMNGLADLTGPIEIPDNLGSVTLDLNGQDARSPSAGQPVIRIIPGGGGGQPTQIMVVSNGGDATVQGGAGAPAIEVADGAQAGVRVDVGQGVQILAGEGGGESPVVSYALYGTVEGVVPVAATVYDGYLHDGSGNLKGTIQVKVGKPGKDSKAAVKATMIGLDGKKKTLKAAEKGKAQIAADGPTTVALVGGEACEVTLGAKGMAGKYGSYTIDGALNVFVSKEASDKAVAVAALGKWQGAVNVAWRLAGDGSPHLYGAPYQTLSVTIAAKGKAKVSGMLADGTKVSAKGQLIVGEEWCCVPVVYVKKGVKLAFNVWLPGTQGEGALPTVIGLGEDVKVGKPGTLKAGATFKLGGEMGDAKYAAYLPDGVAVGGGAKWTLPKAGKVQLAKDGTVDASKLGENPSALKLTYRAKDGSFKGSFKTYTFAGYRLKSTVVKVTGVLVNGVGYGTAAAKGVSAPVTVE